MASPLRPPPQPDSPQPRRPLWGIACLVLLPAAGGLLLLWGRPRPATQPAPLPGRGAPAEPQFPTGPTLQGDVSLKNLHFQPLEFRGFPAFFSGLTISCRDNTVTITDAGRSGKVKQEKVVWSGPASAASFVQETAGGVHTLKDASGKVLWSSAAQVAQADLLFERTDDGQARLTGRGGVTLWTGRITPGTQGGAPSQVQSGQKVLIVTPSVRVEGAGGFYRVTADKLLWSGRLPQSPLIVLRDGHGFVVEAPGGSESGSDEASRVSLDAGAETVTVADAQGRTLGTRRVDALTIRRTTGLSPLPQGFNQPVRYQAQDGRLDAVGTLLLTYRDTAGRIVRRSRIWKDTRGAYGFSG